MRAGTARVGTVVDAAGAHRPVLDGEPCKLPEGALGFVARANRRVRGLVVVAPGGVAVEAGGRSLYGAALVEADACFRVGGVELRFQVEAERSNAAQVGARRCGMCHVRFGEGDSVVVCPNATCAIVLCDRCAELDVCLRCEAGLSAGGAS